MKLNIDDGAEDLASGFVPLKNPPVPVVPVVVVLRLLDPNTAGADDVAAAPAPKLNTADLLVPAPLKLNPPDGFAGVAPKLVVPRPPEDAELPPIPKLNPPVVAAVEAVEVGGAWNIEAVVDAAGVIAVELNMPLFPAGLAGSVGGPALYMKAAVLLASLGPFSSKWLLFREGATGSLAGDCMLNNGACLGISSGDFVAENPVPVL